MGGLPATFVKPSRKTWSGQSVSKSSVSFSGKESRCHSSGESFMSRFAAFLVLVITTHSLTAPRGVAAPVRVAGTDIGSKGIRAVVIEYDDAVPNAPVKIVHTNSINPNLGALKDGMFVPDRIAEAADNLADIVNNFTTEHGVKKENIKLVGSSSLVKVTNRDELVKAVAEKTGITMTFLQDRTQETELEVAGLAILGKPAAGLLITVGNGNSGAGADGSLTKFDIPLGTGTLADKATERQKADDKLTFPEALAAARDMDLLPIVKAAVEANPSLVGKTPVTMIGGIGFAAAAVVHPEKAGDDTVALTLADFRKLIALVGKEPLAIPEVDLSVVPEAVRKRAETDLRTVRDNFPPKSLLAGATLVIAIGDSLQLDEKPLTFIRNAQYAWIVGLLAPKTSPSPKKKDPDPVVKKDEPKKNDNIPKLPVKIEAVKPPPEPLPMGVPYTPTPNGGYVPLGPSRPFPYVTPYTYPVVSGRYSWDYNGGSLGWSPYGYRGAPATPWANPYLLYPR
jgi:hypothetical protein